MEKKMEHEMETLSPLKGVYKWPRQEWIVATRLCTLTTLHPSLSDHGGVDNNHPSGDKIFSLGSRKFVAFAEAFLEQSEGMTLYCGTPQFLPSLPVQCKGKSHVPIS